jgi:hypothetical protein
VIVELCLLQGTVSFKVSVLATPDSESKVRNVRGLRLCWIPQMAVGHVHISSMYGMGISAVPLIVCLKLSLRIICTFISSIIGIKLRGESPTVTVSYGEVAMSFPYA